MRFRAAIPIDQSLAVEGESIYAGLGGMGVTVVMLSEVSPQPSKPKDDK